MHPGKRDPVQLQRPHGTIQGLAGRTLLSPALHGRRHRRQRRIIKYAQDRESPALLCRWPCSAGHRGRRSACPIPAHCHTERRGPLVAARELRRSAPRRDVYRVAVGANPPGSDGGGAPPHCLCQLCKFQLWLRQVHPIVHAGRQHASRAPAPHPPLLRLRLSQRRA